MSDDAAHRDEHHEHQRDIGKLWGEVRELGGRIDVTAAELKSDIRALKIVVMGEDGSNGLRSKLAASETYNRQEHQKLGDCQAGLHTRIDAEVEAVKLALSELEKKVDASIAWGKHVWEKERYLPGMCIGHEEVKALRAELETKEKERIEKMSRASDKVKKSKLEWAKLNWDKFIGIAGLAAMIYVAVQNNATAEKIAAIQYIQAPVKHSYPEPPHE